MRNYIHISALCFFATAAVAEDPPVQVAAPSPVKVDLNQEWHQGVADAKTNYVEQSTQYLSDFKNNVYKGARELRDWWLTPPEHKPPRAVPPSYCYRTFQDVVCYRQPVAGWENRIVAYQGTGAPPPPPAVTQPLPTRSANVAMQPQNRINASQPVFVNIPPAPKEEVVKPQDASVSAAPDPSAEALPDPTHSPQL